MRLDSDNFTRPDPQKGVVADRHYAELYAASHANKEGGFDYKLGYAALLLLDQLLPEGYSLLDVGCGTGGYHRMLKRYGRIVGLDFSPEMIKKAEELKARFGLANIDYRTVRFEDFQDTACFDGLSLIGVFGWYTPWKGKEAMLIKAAFCLVEGGIAVFSYVPPKTVFQLLKCMLLPGRTMLIRRNTFLSKLSAAGFSPCLELHYPHVVIVYARKVGAVRD